MIIVICHLIRNDAVFDSILILIFLTYGNEELELDK